MRKRSKFEHYVFSVYSSVLGNYPYYPFIAKDINSGIRKYIAFLSNRDSICDGAELHVIGTCNVYKDKIDPENLVPYIIPQRVELKNNIFSRLLVLSECYMQAFTKYLKTLKERKNFKNGKASSEN